MPGAAIGAAIPAAREAEITAVPALIPVEPAAGIIRATTPAARTPAQTRIGAAGAETGLATTPRVNGARPSPLRSNQLRIVRGARDEPDASAASLAPYRRHHYPVDPAAVHSYHLEAV